MQELTGFQRDLLYILAGLEQPHGLRVKKEVESYYGREINTGHLYPNLDSLAEMGLVEKGELDNRTNYYEIKKEGVRLIEDRERWERNCLGATKWVRPAVRGV